MSKNQLDGNQTNLNIISNILQDILDLLSKIFDIIDYLFFFSNLYF